MSPANLTYGEINEIGSYLRSTPQLDINDGDLVGVLVNLCTRVHNLEQANIKLTKEITDLTK